MAKVSVIKLTEKSIMSKAKKDDQSYWSVREIELNALEALFLIAANSNKSCTKLVDCYDLVDEVKNIGEDAESFKISNTDLKDFLIPAIEKSADQRPGFWFFARNMFKSIEKPEEIEV